jgi:disease resistance protein RPM1
LYFYHVTCIFDFPEQISEVVLLAVTKISFILGDEATNAIIAKLSEEVSNLKELPVKVEQIRKQLTVMGCVIRKIVTAYPTNKDAMSWIGEVRNVAFHIEDVMDKYSYYVLQLQKEGFLKNFFIEGTHYVKVFSEIAEEVVAVEKEILQTIEIKDQWLQHSELVPNQFTEMEIQRSQDSYPEFAKDESLVGIGENRKLLTGWLYSEEPESTVIIVFGMGGLGKSTLIKDVYEREKINFHAHAWINVSQIDPVEDLLRKLLWKIGFTEQALYVDINKMDKHELKKEIQHVHGNRKCLIVLEDVWNEEVYFHIHDAFQNLQGSRILITTRKLCIAQCASPARCLELQPLSKPDAFDLFCRRAFYNKKDHMCSQELQKIATSIVDRCQGLPLAIVIIGSMLSSKQRLDIWTQKYNQFLRDLSNIVQAVLNLSYSDLAGDVRNCLLYCSLFPVDHPMPRDCLVRMWVAEGLVLSKEKKTPEVVAEGILKELIHRNLLELVEDDEFGRVSACKMHNVVHDLVSIIAEEQGFDSRDECPRIDGDMYVRRLSLCGWKNDTGLIVKLPSLRTVVSVRVILSTPCALLSSILSESIYLTVLELQDSEVTQVPASIGSLFNLRYIGLRRTKVKSLPESVKNLSNLHTLDVKQTEIKKLPRGIVKIRKLRHLLADRYDDKKQKEFSYFIGVQAPENLSNLQELETLEVLESSNDLAEQLKKLMQLRSVWIENISASDCANLFATLSNMPLLSSLVLSAKDENETLCFKALKPRSTELDRLVFRGQWAKGTLDCPIFRCHGPNLKHLDLSWCDLGKDPLGMLAPHLPNITYLKLANMHSANTLIISADYFPNLKTLVLNHLPDVREVNIMDGSVPRIEGLYIISLWMLDTLPRGIGSLHSLKKLWLLDLHKDFIRQWYTSGMPQKVLHVSQVRV